ncbi:hypothetical protein HYH03_001783 [Edaphochlamys debaryana]|uniref:Alkyl transferase n=1 Tax=Edaphochlamys debaryana TaxID=47281 RepID=A0A836C5M7_9CHLO|nr:hypothetical protein HYH03_001783 [Edaphochlamys debaryana]|eukprot:KAG2500203.1 hypothetical protein HYH03_001783 [Edaphochlamys debaryana]
MARMAASLLQLLGIWLRRCISMLLYLLGCVPQHVAFVMDGNRRYAERRHIDKATGHTHGYGKMVDVIHWCIELGVKHITVYAFSIDNYKRSMEEVSALMHLAEEKYKELARDDGLAEREGIRMAIVGDLELPPPPVQGAAARLMRGTASLRLQRATLNVCFSYTSSEETVHAASQLQAAVRSGELLPSDVTPAALTGSLRTGPSSPPVDLLIRTSGETRLSDFLLWQASHAHLCYLPVLWPDLSYLDFAQCVLSYQRHAPHMAALRRTAEARLAEAGGAAGPAIATAEARAAAPEPAGPAALAAEAGQGPAGPSASTGRNGSHGAAGLRQRRFVAAAGEEDAGIRGGKALVDGSTESSPRDVLSGGGGSSGPSSARGSDGGGARVSGDGEPAASAGWGAQGLARGLLASWCGLGGRGGVGSGHGRAGGNQGGAGTRLASFFRRLEAAQMAWIASHADL